MAVIANILLVFGLILLLLAWVCTAFPSLLKDKKTGDVPRRWRVFLQGNLVALVMLGVAGSLLDEQPRQAPPDAATVNGEDVAMLAQPTASAQPAPKPEQQIARQAEEKPTSAKPAPDQTLNIKPEAFKTAFNKLASRVYEDLRIPALTIEDGEVNDVFNHSFGGGVSMIGAVSKADGTIREALVAFGAGESDPVRRVAIILGVAQALNPGSDQESVNAAVIGLVKGADSSRKQQFHAEVGSVRYSVISSEQLGVMFSVAPNK